MRKLLSLALLAAALTSTTAAQESGVIVFKSSIEQVAVAALVRDSRGRLVKDLKATDFELFDDGQKRALTNVWSEPSPASVAILMDASGSMAAKLPRARETANALVAGLQPGSDEVAFYTFDTSLKEVRPFSTTFSIDDAWGAAKAYGATSLWDAIADTAQRISDRQRRRALVVITDGVDSASTMKPADVSAIASSLDVPVYILVIGFAIDESVREAPARGALADLAAWTGGDSLAVNDTPGALAAAEQLLGELHHQYIVAFEPGTTPGWHALVLRARKPGLFVRARSGYMVK
ncbi:MAG TPA: VWA domain-containing protein [Vicinamibacterales bacterium]|nr:VWA domain-containing protein [Vicinamibacterales bacterium]